MQKHLELPPTFAMHGNANFEETDENILKVWGKLRSEIRGFIGVMFTAVDACLTHIRVLIFSVNCKISILLPTWT